MLLLIKSFYQNETIRGQQFWDDVLFHLKHNAIKIHGPCSVQLYKKDSEIKWESILDIYISLKLKLSICIVVGYFNRNNGLFWVGYI